MKVKLKDGSVREYDDGASAADIIKGISEGLLRNSTGALADGVSVGLCDIVKDGAEFCALTVEDEKGLEIYRHTASHVMAQAMKRLYPEIKLAIGPATATGFYYDFEIPDGIKEEDFLKIEAEIEKIIKADLAITRRDISSAEAIKLFERLNEPYKAELIRDLDTDAVSLYEQGEFVDLCRGPHLPSTGRLKAVKLLSVTGAYWRGSEKNKMLTRIYATAFDKRAKLDEFLTALSEAKRRDHNKLGRELQYFMTEENIGQGLPLLMPKGSKVIQILARFVEDEEDRRGYFYTRTPAMAKAALYKISGHWDHYRDGMFILGEEGKDDGLIALRPMTCPFQFMMYKNGIKSYRDLPVRYNETASLFRNEASGEMHGLIRVRQFTLSDGHIICRPDQLEDEFKGVLDLIYYLLDCIGLRDDVTFRFSKWDPANTEKYINNPEAWARTEAEMKKILDRLGLEYTEAVGEAAFYGPKLDLQMRNVFGKEDTVITVQVDFANADRFNMEYVDESGVKRRPIIIHRSSIGCYERTLALLIEKFGGALPLWLAPEQVVVMSLTDRTVKDAHKTAERLKAKGIRATVDVRTEKIGYKIREAQLNKIPYMLIIGDKDKEAKVVSVRSRSAGDIGATKLADFIKKVQKEVKGMAK